MIRRLSELSEDEIDALCAEVPEFEWLLRVKPDRKERIRWPSVTFLDDYQG